MSFQRLQVKVPGKLMIAGEYAVLEKYQKAIVMAVDKYVTATIEESNENSLSLPQFGLKHLFWKYDYGEIQFQADDPRLRFVKIAMATVQQYLWEQSIFLRRFDMTITSDLDDPSGRKYGLGSSAAVVVAVVAAILSFARDSGETINPNLLFKLSAIAHLKAQGSGSGADVAASSFGGWLLYSSFQPEWLLRKINKESRLSKIIEEKWEYLTIEQLSKPEKLMLCVGWTGKPVKTGPLIKYIQKLREQNLSVYNQFLLESTCAVEKIVNGFSSGNDDHVIEGMKQNRQALAKLGKDAEVAIETTILGTLADLAEEIGGAGKPSGAGGGDCGIAFVNGTDNANALQTVWENHDIFPLHLHTSAFGATAIASK